jgi:lipoprotein-releasing system permease protein
MNVRRFIARRYLFGKRKFSFINIISLLAMLGILFGVASLIVVMSVFAGFNNLVTSILQDFDPHLRVERVPRREGIDPAAVRPLLDAAPGVTGVMPFLERKAMALGRSSNVFVRVKGVEAATLPLVSGMERCIVLGNFTVDAPNAIVLGISLADRLRVLPGDTLTIVSPAGMENVLTQFVMPTILRCPVVGIYESKNKLYDGSYAFVSLATARSLFLQPDGITGYDVRLEQIDGSLPLQRALQEKVGDGWLVHTWQDLHRDLYSVMTIERWSAFILLSMIIAVAVFNILASLTMLVLEKQRDIGILRAMGMTGREIQRTFLLQGLWIGLIGTFSGLAVGLTVALLQQHFGLFRLDAAFIIRALPVEIRVFDVAIIALATFLLCLAAAVLPARRAGKVEIIDAIRWE